MGTAWMVRAGRYGERESAAIEQGLVIAGWEELGDLTGCSTKPDLRRLIEKTYTDASRARVGNWTGQLWRLLREMNIGDLVVLPLKTQQVIAIGRLTGEYLFRSDAPPGFQHIRTVAWLRVDLPRSAVQQDLLDSMGSLLTICRLERFGAASRIEQLAECGTDPGPPGGSSTDADSIEALVATAVKHGGRVSMTVRDLLKCAGAMRRTPDNVVQIEADLNESGLMTRPPFTEGGIDSLIEVVVVGDEPNDDPPVEHTFTQSIDATSVTSPFMLRIDRLKSASAGVESVHPDDALEVAQTKMIAKNFSQLAVLDSTDELRGAIGWESIGKALIGGRPTSVRSAMEVAHPVNHDEDLLGRIEEIYRSGYVFVRGPDRRITGIVTAADLTSEFGKLILPLILIEEAERRLRRRVSEVFTAEQIKELTKNRADSAAALTFGNYSYVLKNCADWQRLDWSLDHAIFLAHLTEVRDIRNNFMHFKSDQPKDLNVERLEGFVRLLRTVDPKE